MASNNEQRAPVIVVAVPLPVQSHLNQLLQLASIIASSYDLPVYYVCSSTHVRQVKFRFSNPLLLTKIQFHELPFPPFPSPAPTRGGDTAFPIHLVPLSKAFQQLCHPFATLFQTFCSQAKKIVIIHDALIASVVQDAAASLPNVELYAFDTSSSFTTFFTSRELTGLTISVPEEIEISDDLPSIEGCYVDEFLQFAALQYESIKFRSGDIRNTCRVIEGDYVDLAGQALGNKMQWAVGPLNGLGDNVKQNNSEIGKNVSIEWLDKQPPNSVIYISFGTTCSLAEEQVKELAVGLEESKIRFIWVLKDADRADVFAEEEVSSPDLPKGFEERMEGVGMVLRGWVPQAEILRHPSTGGFMSHCGWASVLESISEGVPILAWPMHSDQPRNAVLVTKVLKMGLILREWSHRKELVTASAVKEAVRTLMASDEGIMMSKRAEELGREVRRATAEGGVSRMELEAFIDHITK